MAVSLNLTDTQQTLLSEVLDKVLGDLSYEISDTDAYDFREELKERRDALKAIADQLS